MSMTKARSAAKPAKKHGAVGEMVEIVKTVIYALLIALVLRVFLFQPYTIPSASEEPNLYRGDYIIVSKWSYGWSQKSAPFLDRLATFMPGRLLFTPPKRGDIIVFKLPSSGSIDYIKRLIGMPGDRIQMKGGRLYINDVAVKEQLLGARMGDLSSGWQPVLRWRETNPEGRSYDIQTAQIEDNPGDNTGVYVVPPHCYFMMGDNRDDSADSRFDPGVSPDDPKLGGCGWNSAVDASVGDQTGVGFVPEENLVGKAQIVLMSWNTGAEEGDTSKATLFKPWTWITDARPSRFFKVLR
ncbi:MAG TPA: signal peptidase I [Caulobacteraceae bacterium]|nr:signal peptidase I [Caulobacteraceae bacterium]